MDRQQKIDATKDAILALLESSGPQSIETIAKECRDQAHLGMMAYAISGLQFDGSIWFDSESNCYEVM